METHEAVVARYKNDGPHLRGHAGNISGLELAGIHNLNGDFLVTQPMSGQLDLQQHIALVTDCNSSMQSHKNQTQASSRADLGKAAAADCLLQLVVIRQLFGIRP